MESKVKLLRITTVPISLNILLKGQLAHVRSQGFEVLTVSADGPEIEELISREKVTHQVIPLTRKITPLRDLMCLWQLVRYIRKEKIAVVHSHTPKAGLIAMLAARICNVPYRFHTVAGMPLMESSGVKRLILKWTEKMTYWNATRVYPNSLKLKAFIEQQIMSRSSKLHVIGAGSSNGIDTTYFQNSEVLVEKGKQLLQVLNISDDSIVYSFVGRIVGDKGINELVEAFKRLNTDSRFKLILIGPFEDDRNPVRPETRREINDNPDILATGFQSDIRPYLSVTDVFVFPSYREGFPNVVLQACAMGVPCIVSDINGCNEIIRNEETGLLVPPKNVEKLFSAMERMAGDKKLRQQFAEKARKHVVDHYDQRYVWEEIVKEYKNQLHV